VKRGPDIEETLNRIEEATAESGPSVEELRDLGFWGAVRAAKRDPAIEEQYADRIGEIDRKAFGLASTMPLWAGVLIALGLTAAGVGLMWLGIRLGAELLTALAFFASAALLATAPHSLTHLVAGKLVGIEFSFYFLNGPLKYEPTVKTDYATYLRATPRSRAFMHASAAIASTVLPLLVLAAAVYAGAPHLVVAPTALLCLYVLFIEALPFAGILTGSWNVLGTNVKKTDVGRAHRELKYAEERDG